MESISCAHKTLPMGTIVEIYYEGRTIQAIVNDRGPYIDGRELDLSVAAFRELAPLDDGVITIDYRVVGREVRDTMLYNL